MLAYGFLVVCNFLTFELYLFLPGLKVITYGAHGEEPGDERQCQGDGVLLVSSS